MKKIALVLLVTLCLVGCSEKVVTAEPTATSTPSVTSQATSTLPPTVTNTPTPTATNPPTPTVTNTPIPTETLGLSLVEGETTMVTTEAQSGAAKYGPDIKDFDTYTKRFDIKDAVNQVDGYILITYDQFKDNSAFCTRYEVYNEDEKRVDIYADIYKDDAGFYFIYYKGSIFGEDIAAQPLVYKKEKIDKSYFNMTLVANANEVSVRNNDFIYAGYTQIIEDYILCKQPSSGDDVYHYIIYPAKGDRQTVYKKYYALGYSEGWEDYIYSSVDSYLKYKNYVRNHTYMLSDGSKILNWDEIYDKNSDLVATAKKNAYDTLVKKAESETGEFELTELVAEDAYGKLELTTKALLYKGEAGKTQIAGSYVLTYTAFEGSSYKWKSYIDSELCGDYIVDGNYTYIVSQNDTQLDAAIEYGYMQSWFKRSVKVTAISADGELAGCYEAEFYPLGDYYNFAKYISIKLTDADGSIYFEKTADGANYNIFGHKVSDVIASGNWAGESKQLKAFNVEASYSLAAENIVVELSSLNGKKMIKAYADVK